MARKPSPWPVFRERKALQAAAHLLRLAGGRLNYMKLLKLLYMADRQALRERGLPITTDRPVCMQRGPVLSNIYSLIRDQAMPGSESGFARSIRRAGYQVQLAQDPGDDELSPYELRVLEGVWAEYGGLDQWQLVEETHKLPEYRDPGVSSFEIAPEEMLAGLSPEEKKARLEALHAVRAADRLFAQR